MKFFLQNAFHPSLLLSIRPHTHAHAHARAHTHHVLYLTGTYSFPAASACLACAAGTYFNGTSQAPLRREASAAAAWDLDGSLVTTSFDGAGSTQSQMNKMVDGLERWMEIAD